VVREGEKEQRRIFLESIGAASSRSARTDEETSCQQRAEDCGAISDERVGAAGTECLERRT
jgi:hypothetical protein